MKLLNLTFLILSSFLLLQCNSSTEGIEACTQEFITYSITVLGTDGEPADSVQIQVSNKENGEIYTICSEEQNFCREGTNGQYTIMHDGFLGKISSDRENLIVEGSKENTQFRAEYTFRSGECHVRKLAGPDTVSLSSN